MSKKTIFTLNVNDYAKKITDLTYPFIKKYAYKIGADFHIINERKFPDFPVVYEKLQIYELAQEMKNDWNIYVDSDALIHPDTFDITELLPKDTVLTCGVDFAPVRWRYDRFFQRDGRNIGAGNWFTIASDLCIDLWKPLDDLKLDEAVENIFPTLVERNFVGEKSHFIDDYVVSRNIAKYGLKFTTFKELLKKYNNPGEFLFHEYCYTIPEKVANINKTLNFWRSGKQTMEGGEE